MCSHNQSNDFSPSLIWVPYPQRLHPVLDTCFLQEEVLYEIWLPKYDTQSKGRKAGSVYTYFYLPIIWATEKVALIYTYVQYV